MDKVVLYGGVNTEDVKKLKDLFPSLTHGLARELIAASGGNFAAAVALAKRKGYVQSGSPAPAPAKVKKKNNRGVTAAQREQERRKQEAERKRRAEEERKRREQAQREEEERRRRKQEAERQRRAEEERKRRRRAAREEEPPVDAKEHAKDRYLQKIKAKLMQVTEADLARAKDPDEVQAVRAVQQADTLGNVIRVEDLPIKAAIAGIRKLLEDVGVGPMQYGPWMSVGLTELERYKRLAEFSESAIKESDITEFGSLARRLKSHLTQHDISGRAAAAALDEGVWGEGEYLETKVGKEISDLVKLGKTEQAIRQLEAIMAEGGEQEGRERATLLQTLKAQMGRTSSGRARDQPAHEKFPGAGRVGVGRAPSGFFQHSAVFHLQKQYDSVGVKIEAEEVFEPKFKDEGCEMFKLLVQKQLLEFELKKRKDLMDSNPKVLSKEAAWRKAEKAHEKMERVRGTHAAQHRHRQDARERRAVEEAERAFEKAAKEEANATPARIKKMAKISRDLRAVEDEMCGAEANRTGSLDKCLRYLDMFSTQFREDAEAPDPLFRLGDIITAYSYLKCYFRFISEQVYSKLPNQNTMGNAVKNLDDVDLLSLFGGYTHGVQILYLFLWRWKDLVKLMNLLCISITLGQLTLDDYVYGFRQLATYWNGCGSGGMYPKGKKSGRSSQIGKRYIWIDGVYYIGHPDNDYELTQRYWTNVGSNWQEYLAPETALGGGGGGVGGRFIQGTFNPKQLTNEVVLRCEGEEGGRAAYGRDVDDIVDYVAIMAFRDHMTVDAVGSFDRLSAEEDGLAFSPNLLQKLEEDNLTSFFTSDQAPAIRAEMAEISTYVQKANVVLQDAQRTAQRMWPNFLVADVYGEFTLTTTPRLVALQRMKTLVYRISDIFEKGRENVETAIQAAALLAEDGRPLQEALQALPEDVRADLDGPAIAGAVAAEFGGADEGLAQRLAAELAQRLVSSIADRAFAGDADDPEPEQLLERVAADDIETFREEYMAAGGRVIIRDFLILQQYANSLIDRILKGVAELEESFHILNDMERCLITGFWCARVAHTGGSTLVGKPASELNGTAITTTQGHELDGAIEEAKQEATEQYDKLCKEIIGRSGGLEEEPGVVAGLMETMEIQIKLLDFWDARPAGGEGLVVTIQREGGAADREVEVNISENLVDAYDYSASLAGDIAEKTDDVLYMKESVDPRVQLGFIDLGFQAGSRRRDWARMGRRLQEQEDDEPQGREESPSAQEVQARLEANLEEIRLLREQHDIASAGGQEPDEQHVEGQGDEGRRDGEPDEQYEEEQDDEEQRGEDRSPEQQPSSPLAKLQAEQLARREQHEQELAQAEREWREEFERRQAERAEEDRVAAERRAAVDLPPGASEGEVEARERRKEFGVSYDATDAALDAAIDAQVRALEQEQAQELAAEREAEALARADSMRRIRSDASDVSAGSQLFEGGDAEGLSSSTSVRREPSAGASDDSMRRMLSDASSGSGASDASSRSQLFSDEEFLSSGEPLRLSTSARIDPSVPEDAAAGGEGPQGAWNWSGSDDGDGGEGSRPGSARSLGSLADSWATGSSGDAASGGGKKKKSKKKRSKKKRSKMKRSKNKKSKMKRKK